MEKRIYQIAKELNISHIQILKFLESKSVKVANHMAFVNNDIYDTILLEFSKEKKQVERTKKERARQAINADQNTKNDSIEVKQVTPKPDITLVPQNKIILKESKTDDISSDKLDVSTDKDDNSSDKPVRKLKKINISEIADKIQKTNKLKGPNKKLNISESIKKTSKKNKKKIKKKMIDEEILVDTDNLQKLQVPEFTSIDELSKLMKVSAQDVILKCIEMGMMVTINQRLDMESIQYIANEFGFDVDTLDIYSDSQNDDNIDAKKDFKRPPVVTIMGHVDHGKTSLLDYIRDTNIIAGESGGITQHIGAYEVEVKDDNKITFVDTPGHEAFTAMRARGAQITDIVILIVAGDDGIKPQTVEAIDHALAANVPIIVAINKMDKPEANSDKVKKELSEKNILVEEWGGKRQCAEISAKTGKGVDDLIDKILLESEMIDLMAAKDCTAKGIVIESKLDKGLGPIATVLIQSGTLSKGNIFVCGSQYSKVRLLLNERSNKVEKAYPSDPVQILGFQKVPNAGDVFKVYEDEQEAKKITQERSVLERERAHQMHSKITLEQVGKEIKSGKVSDLNILIKGDVDGSIGALSDALMGLSNEEVNIKIIHSGVGMVSQNDVTLSSASNAIIICFNVSASVNAKRLSKSLGVEIRHYSVIYDAINDTKLALEGLLRPDIVEESIGQAEVREMFKIPKIGIIAGCSIINGKVIRNSKLRVRREDEVIYEGKLTSLKRFKDDVSEVLEGFECGIGIEGFTKFEDKDIIEVYELKEIKRKLK